jgi:hypothetical protein
VLLSQLSTAIIESGTQGGGAAMNDPVVIKRLELYRKMWEKPAVQLEGELGVSVDRLKLICRKHDIPRPKAGHWVQVRHGSKEQDPLPRPDEDWDITIGTPPCHARDIARAKLAPITMSRGELYDRVWQKTVVRLAREFGICESYLVNICRRNQIPLTPQGYWNRSEADRKQFRTPLPNPDRDTVIAIQPSMDPAQRAADHESAGIVVPDRVGSFHRLVRQARSHMKTAMKDEYGRYIPGIGCLSILVTQKSRLRACRIMNTIIKECDARGWSIAFSEGYRDGTVVDVDGGEVAVWVEELLDRTPRVRTEEERLREKKMGRSYAHPAYSRTAGGRLALNISVPGDNGRKVWRDGKRFRMETQLDKFFEGLAQAGERVKALERRLAEVKAERQKERKKERAREALRRMEEEARQHEEEQVDALIVDAKAWATSQTVRAYVLARLVTFQERGIDTGEDTKEGQWGAWAMKQADRLDPLVEGETVSKRPVDTAKSLTYEDVLGAVGDLRRTQPAQQSYFQQRWWNKER